MLHHSVSMASFFALGMAAAVSANTIIYENTFDAPGQVDVATSGFNAHGYSGSQHGGLIINQLFTTTGGVGGSNARVTEIVTANEPGLWWVGTQGYFPNLDLTTSDASQLILTIDVKASSANQIRIFIGDHTLNKTWQWTTTLAAANTFQTIGGILTQANEINGGSTITQVGAFSIYVQPINEWEWGGGFGSGDTHTITFDNVRIAVIPEPTSMLLMACGGLLLLARRQY